MGLSLSAMEETKTKRDPNNPCLFCTDPRGVSLERELAFSARDTYPSSPGHTLVIPRRHVASFFDLTAEEVSACLALITEAKLSAWRAKPDRTADINHCMAAKGWFRLPDHIYSL